MADEQTVDFEAEAKSLGWAPKERWRGPEEQWVDAETFMQTNRLVLPILRKKNQELHATVATLNGKNASLEGEVAAIKTALQTVQANQEADTAERIKSARADLAKQLKDARDENDTARELELLDMRDDLKKAETAAKTVPETKPAPAAPVVPPQLQDFLDRHKDEVEADPGFMDEVLILGASVRRAGFQGPAFFTELEKRLDRVKGEEEERPVSKTEGSNGGRRPGGAKGYTGLPAEAKSVCDQLEKQMVGANRAHKDQASWRKSYAEQYYTGAQK